jgi:hypothetical protein
MSGRKPTDADVLRFPDHVPHALAPAHVSESIHADHADLVGATPKIPHDRIDVL